jgi:hypothetical protein
MLIKQIVNSGDRVLLIACPRRFGKSTNLDMIKNFLKIHADEYRNQIADVEKSKNYKLFKKLINGKSLKIMDERDFLGKHMAKHTVIFVNFKDTNGQNNEDLENSIKRAISYAFHDRHNVLKIFRNIMNNGEVEERIKAEVKLQTFYKIYNYAGQNASKSDIEDSLKESIYFS